MASGSGTNAENLLNYAQEKKYFDIRAVITDQPGAGVIERAEKYGVDCFIVPIKKKTPSETFTQAKKEQEKKVVKLLKDRDVEWILLAGYMRILSPEFISHFWDTKLEKSRIVNIHPALLPQFPGANAYEQAWNAGVEVSGITVHHVDSGIDTGPIIIQETFERLANDDFESFKKKGMEVEYQLYKKAIDKLFPLENVRG